MTPAAFALVALLLGALALRHGRWIHVVAYIGSVTCVAVGIWTALGTPRPTWLGHKAGVSIIAMTYKEGQAIWLWVRDGDNTPIVYALPWSEKRAEEARQAMEAAKQAHTTARWGSPAGQGQAGGQGRGPRGDGQAGAGNSGNGGASGVGGPGHEFDLAPHHAMPPKSDDQ